MAGIKVLPKYMAELIAAGEVVERPASVIKELCENSVDAGATKITVEVQRGGITYMRVTDNGSGIPHDEVPTAFLRHATSKIKNEDDLYSIDTLGFRGEALASIASVAKVEILTKTADEEMGTRYVIEGGVEKEYDVAGCPDGTTIIIRDLFYNVPARMKFLKTDLSESTAVMTAVDHIALCNPQIAVKLIRDSKMSLSTSGDGKLISAIYSVLGRDYVGGVIPVDAVSGDIRVTGYVSKPVYCRASRNGQYFALNGRIIKSGTAVKAVETAYKNTIMVGKFPNCVLNISMPYDRVDVNVHPAKTEVRFHDEKSFFDAVYYAVKNALIKSDSRPELELSKTSAARVNSAAEKGSSKMPKPFEKVTVEEFKRIAGKEPTEAQLGFLDGLRGAKKLEDSKKTIYKDVLCAADYIPEAAPPKKSEAKPKVAEGGKNRSLSYSDYIKPEVVAVVNPVPEETLLTIASEFDIELKYIGEAYKTYIMVEYKGSIYFIDKHAAHERILFEKLKKERTVQPQYLISPIAVTLSRAEHKAVIENLELLREAGFEVEEFGTVSVLVRAVPTELVDQDVMFSICEVADGLVKSGKVESEKLENLYHTVACRGAIKAGNNQSPAELEALAKMVLSNNDIMYCPHGRPVAFELKRSELEKQFGRIN